MSQRIRGTISQTDTVGVYDVDLTIDEVTDPVAPPIEPPPVGPPEPIDPTYPDPPSIGNYEWPGILARSSSLLDLLFSGSRVGNNIAAIGASSLLQQWASRDITTETSESNVLRIVEARITQSKIEGTPVNFDEVMAHMRRLGSYDGSGRLQLSLLWAALIIDHLQYRTDLSYTEPQLEMFKSWAIEQSERDEAKYGRNQPGGILRLVLGEVLHSITMRDEAWAWLTNPVGAEGSGDWRNLPEIDYYTPDGGNAEGNGGYLQSWKYVLPFFSLWKLLSGQDLWKLSPGLRGLADYVCYCDPERLPLGSYWSSRNSVNKSAASIAVQCLANTDDALQQDALCQYLDANGWTTDDGKYYPFTFHCIFGDYVASPQGSVPDTVQFGKIGITVFKKAAYTLALGQNEHMGYRSCLPGVMTLTLPDGSPIIFGTRSGIASHYYWKREWGWPFAAAIILDANGDFVLTRQSFTPVGSASEFGYGTELPSIPNDDVIGSTTYVPETDIWRMQDLVRNITRVIKADSSQITVTDGPTVRGNGIMHVSWPVAGNPVMIEANKFQLAHGVQMSVFGGDCRIHAGVGQRDMPQITEDPDLRYWDYGGFHRIDVEASSDAVTTIIEFPNG